MELQGDDYEVRLRLDRNHDDEYLDQQKENGCWSETTWH